MDGLDPSALQAVAGWLLLAGLFVLREIASGALKQVGEEAWAAIKRRRGKDGDDCDREAAPAPDAICRHRHTDSKGCG